MTFYGNNPKDKYGQIVKFGVKIIGNFSEKIPD